MSLAARPAPDRQAFIAMVDGFAAEFGLPTYSELARAIHDQDRRASDFYGTLRTVESHVGDLQLLLAQTGLDQPRAVVEHVLEEALEKATAAAMAAGIALFTAETRVDLDGRTDVIVMAEARTRLRAVGRRL